jgi:hypothetical protein
MTPKKVKSTGHEERNELEKLNREKNSKRQHDGSDTSPYTATKQDVNLAETLGDTSMLSGQSLGSFAGLIYDDITEVSTEERQTLPECYGQPFTSFSREGRVDPDIDMTAAELSRRVRGLRLVGEDAQGWGMNRVGSEMPIDLDKETILDCSNAFWDVLVEGSVPFEFETGGDGGAQANNGA